MEVATVPEPGFRLLLGGDRCIHRMRSYRTLQMNPVHKLSLTAISASAAYGAFLWVLYLSRH